MALSHEGSSWSEIWNGWFVHRLMLRNRISFTGNSENEKRILHTLYYELNVPTWLIYEIPWQELFKVHQAETMDVIPSDLSTRTVSLRCSLCHKPFALLWRIDIWKYSRLYQLRDEEGHAGSRFLRRRGPATYPRCLSRAALLSYEPTIVWLA